MRASTGLGLIAIIGGLFACTASGVAEDPTLGGGAGESGTSTDPTSPEASSDPTDPEKAPSPLVSNLTVTGVAVFQAVQVDVVKSGSFVAPSKRNAPVVAKRPGLIRVYVEPGDGWKAREVTAEVRLVADDEKFPILRETKRISSASKDDDPKSTFNLEVPAEDLLPGVTFQVALTASDGALVDDGAESEARFPRDGSFKDLGVSRSGKLKVVIVPVRYDTDGSGRTPDVGPTQLERYKKTLMQRYPTSEVELTTRAPYPWTTTISGNGTGFSSVLRAMHQLRQRDNAADDVYYYGLLAPSSSMNAFCQGGCVAGLSTVARENTPVLRASVGVGFVGQDAANTMAHEIGHAHGREHAPCGGASGVDPSFPYPQAQLGVWGYDIFDKTLISPTRGRDMMGYCPNEWVSDYTYNALFDRITAITTEKISLSSATASSGSQGQAAARYRIAVVGPTGDLTWDAASDIAVSDALKGGSAAPAHFLSANGQEMVTRTARFFAFDHLPGGFLFVPEEAGVAWSSLRVDGYREQLTR
ncbi:MAG: hypothetical protein KF764_05495 [Labilithrix sp.]|nr:hypothetical protein [Labilithrix sp.]MBX3219067.1 hypothetical protein [Labilithrix sp.]